MSENLILSYDREADVLEVRTEPPCPSYGEEIDDGLFVIRSMEDDHIIGLTVVDFSRKQADQGLKLPIPCEISQKIVNKITRSAA